MPLLVGACKQGMTLVLAIAKFLPPDREVVVLDAFTNGPNDLADVRIIEEILRRLSFLFLPKPKRA